MVMSPTALVMERRQIDAIIKSDPVEVVLQRRPKIPTPDNSFKWGAFEPVYQPDRQGEPQIAALIPFKRRLSEALINTELGDVETVPYTLVCYHDADIQRDDQFELDGDKFYVKWLDIKTQVRKTAGVDYVGGDPR